MTEAQQPTAETVEQHRFPCAQCGGKLQFEPGTDHLVCPYCGHDNPVPKTAARVVEQDFRSMLAQAASAKPTQELHTVKCDACGALPRMPPDVTSMRCPFCGSNIVSQARADRTIRPEAVLPFAINDAQSRELFRRWVASRWFAPSELKARALAAPRIDGYYLPFWTYDADTSTQYVGRRGDAYYVPVTYTVNGRTQTRMERRIRWSPASGVVNDSFDDLLVAATASLPRNRLDALEPWDLDQLKPYADDYLAGFSSEAYQVDLEQGFGIAREMMVPTIEQSVRADIGGDEQQITDMRTRYGKITFKHILLPVWITAYRYREKSYRIIVNARTGEIQGDRPYSVIKITLAVLAALALIAIVVAIVAINNR